MKHVLQRLLLAFPLVLLFSLLAFALLRVAPGGPFDQERAPARPEIEAALQERYRTNDPLWKQYLRYVGLLWNWFPHDGWVHAQTGLFQGHPGPSLTYPAHEVRERLAEALHGSITLGFLAITIAIGLGVPCGLFAALRTGRWPEVAGCLSALLLIWMPVFALGPFAALTWAGSIEDFPVTQSSVFHSRILPAAIVGVFLAFRIARLIQDEARMAWQSSFVLAARARGLSESALLRRHVFRLALVRVHSEAGTLLASLWTGVVVVENVFYLAGLGTVLVHGTRNRDFIMIVNAVLLAVLLLLLCRFVAGLLHRMLDPRLRHA
jgi:oligopeptide transport system permease protein